MLTDKEIYGDRVLGFCGCETAVEKAGEFWTDLCVYGQIKSF
jgi:hypothetical protein